MKIIKTKEYEMLNKQIDMLTKQVLKQQNELHTLQNIYNLSESNNQVLSTEIEGYKKEIKNLKSLCSKNKVDYKKLYKKEK